MEVSEQIEKFQEFFDSYKDQLHEIARLDSRSIQIDFSELSKFDLELAENLLSNPEDILKAAEVSLTNFDIPFENIRVRFFNLPNSQKLTIRDIRSVHLGRFISIEGIVRQTSDVRPQVTAAKFECPSCGTAITILQIESKFKEPSRCSCGRQGRFRLILKELVDAQRIVLEEAPEDLEGGEQPKRLAIFLKEDLVEPKMEKRTTPGSKISVSGIVKEIAIPLRTGGQSTRFDLVMDANSIIPIQEDFIEIKIDKKDEEEIKNLAKDPKIYEKFIASVAPSIYGHEDIKGALVLQLMGGVKKQKSDKTTIRGDIHLLLVGDPGAAKSTILTYISKAAPKARYVAGRSTTGAGITASVVKDEFLRGWALEAGALVLANKGILCLDEMDKMSEEDTSALHEAMEQQQISISKANIQTTLRAETTILAAANPKFGRFDPYSPIASQINLPPTLINRFDLIFTIRDIPNPKTDERIAKHVLEIQQKPESLKTEIPLKLFRKYVAYVRQNIFPQLTDAAIDEIKNFYVDLRNRPTVGDETVKPIPISARQLEALVRLAEGSARVRLSQKVTKQDSKRAIDILKHCLMQVGFDYETGQIDIDRISTGISTSERKKIISVREIISELEKKLGGKMIPIEDVVMESKEKGIAEDKVNESIEKLKRSGDIYEPRHGFVSRV